MRKHCEEFGKLIPWYASGTLDREEKARLEAHLQHCPTCRAELAETLQVAQAVKASLFALPGPGEHVWDKLLSALQFAPLARVDVGSFLLGISVWLTVRGRQVLLGGDLRLLGRKYSLFAEEA